MYCIMVIKRSKEALVPAESSDATLPDWGSAVASPSAPYATGCTATHSHVAVSLCHQRFHTIGHLQ